MEISPSSQSEEYFFQKTKDDFPGYKIMPYWTGNHTFGLRDFKKSDQQSQNKTFVYTIPVQYIPHFYINEETKTKL